jgi:hypothetical protein
LLGFPRKGRILLSRRGPLSAALVAVVLSAIVASPALGDAALGGSPLNVIVGPQGQLQAFRSDRTPPGIFYEPQTQLGDAGFFLAIPAGGSIIGADANKTFGFEGSAGSARGWPADYTAVSAGAVTSSGGTLSQVTTYDAGTSAEVKQTTTYVNGSQEFRVHWDVKNISGGTLKFRAISAADFFFEGDDAGTGIFTQGPPRFIGGTNLDSGSSGGFVEVSPSWSHYQALDYPSVWTKTKAAAGVAPNQGVFDDTVVSESVDNAGAVEWDQQLATGIANNATTSFEVVVRSAVPSQLQLNPTNAGSRQGVPVNITATATDTNGQPYAGKTLRYTIAGPNQGNGSAVLDAAGSAVVTDPGANAGTDTVTVYVDFNGNGTREDVEPQASAQATFVDSVPPTCTIKVSGTLVGGGGSGKPLVVNVNCGEGGTVTVATTLQPPAARSHSASASAKKKKPKKIKLKTKTVSVIAGTPTAVKLKIPKSVARKYAGKTLRATLVVTAKDAAGNVKKTTLHRRVKLAKIKKRHR